MKVSLLGKPSNSVPKLSSITPLPHREASPMNHFRDSSFHASKAYLEMRFNPSLKNDLSHSPRKKLYYKIHHESSGSNSPKNKSRSPPRKIIAGNGKNPHLIKQALIQKSEENILHQIHNLNENPKLGNLKNMYHKQNEFYRKSLHKRVKYLKHLQSKAIEVIHKYVDDVIEQEKLLHSLEKV
ncbi:unnamed protein product [Blepharisma stoltei]|uniref:Uncharacterized protein n=1 Tax=Blepharisma stoltei TaxID=1481888 RepID=A0AAU9JCY3_9CILI|nr:unnamed protein product [Blepharisma stoltei]